jgi:tRNA pseudouridine55 synthase
MYSFKMEKTIPSGILVVDKPKGLTSHDVVNIVRRMFNIKKVGHAGTLDPIATGVLVILIGKATKKSDILAGDDKEYIAKMRLGIATDTGDAFGKVTSTSKLERCDKGLIEETIMSFRGEIDQVPPMYSAVKYKGRSLYKWARKGVTVQRNPRRITIKDISIKEIAFPEVVFDVVCTKGTYIRQLCVDIGERIGCGAHMTELRRVRSGDFHISQAIDVDRLKSIDRDALVSSLR